MKSVFEAKMIAKILEEELWLLFFRTFLSISMSRLKLETLLRFLSYALSHILKDSLNQAWSQRKFEMETRVKSITLQ